MIDHQALRQSYLLEIAHRLRQPGSDRIIARALAVISKWETSSGMHRRYVVEWRRLLAEGADAVEEIAVARTPEALELQHCMPFAGILTNLERRNLRAKH